LQAGRNSRAIFSSKGVGEPPLFMGSSVFFAISDALVSVRKERLGVERAAAEQFVLHSPATAERIRMAACDDITGNFMKTGAKSEHFQPKGSF
jgi:xanthine dehydrogenase/oxidase